MLLRFYRLTDRFGVVFLKCSIALIDWLLDAAHMIVKGLLTMAATVFGLFSGDARSNSPWMIGLLQRIGILDKPETTVANRPSATDATRGNRGASSTSTRSREAVPDRKIDEDPLRVENRRLSFLVLVMGVIVVGSLIWATDPTRGQPVSSFADGGSAANGLALLAATAAPTQESNLGLVALPTPIPTATPVPDALQPRGAVAFSVRENAQTDIWAVSVGSREAIRLTNNPAEERDPEWTVDGGRLAYAARSEDSTGSWDIYVYDAALQSSTQVTFDLSFQGNPTWSHDGRWIAYENYVNDNLDIYALPIDGSQPPQVITNHRAADFSPSWSPEGRRIAFVSWRDGSQDIFVTNLDLGTIENVTNTPLINEDHPDWSPDGRMLAYSAFEQGSEKVFVIDLENPQAGTEAISFGRAPSWSQDGNSLAFAVDAIDGTRTDIRAIAFGDGGLPIQLVSAPYGATAPNWTSNPLPVQVVSSGGVPMSAAVPFEEQITENVSGAPYVLRGLGDVRAPRPLLSDRVDDSFLALRQRVAATAATDFLGQLDDVFWPLDRPAEPGQTRQSWHRTGRAFAIPRDSFLGFPPEIEIMREDRGVSTYWRVFVRVDDRFQSGQLGEPLRQLPWDFRSATEGGDVEAYNQGGRYRAEIPAGYYVDLTLLAADYGWRPVPAGSDWRANALSRNYWMYVNDGGLSWIEAMREIYTDTDLVQNGIDGGPSS